jgi:hypothetical protein
MVARFLATCPREEFRDGARAVHLARAACEQNNWANPSDRSVLAAAYAEMGNFQEAVSWQELALLDSSMTEQLRKDREHRLKLYRDKKPFREE